MMIGAEPPQLQHRDARGRRRGPRWQLTGCRCARTIRSASTCSDIELDGARPARSSASPACRATARRSCWPRCRARTARAPRRRDPARAARDVGHARRRRAPRARPALRARGAPRPRRGAGACRWPQNTLLTAHRQGMVGARAGSGAAASRGSRRALHRGASTSSAGGPRGGGASLSGGNLQKFIVGREIDAQPKVLIVAQPTWGVDVGAARADPRRAARAARRRLRACWSSARSSTSCSRSADRLGGDRAGAAVAPSVGRRQPTATTIGEWMSGLWRSGCRRPTAQPSGRRDACSGLRRRPQPSRAMRCASPLLALALTRR